MIGVGHGGINFYSSPPFMLSLFLKIYVFLEDSLKLMLSSLTSHK